ncbi:hypothetical protein [Chitinophaga barathri]|uniref:Lipoprotein n=1 Tax=Chitinophaga barathri TaxID=1647451 RepID=A0A3N4MAZ2_9BACT|nr:hypothetical protein [Chitinophaga barathri]RPD40761.1 hypothetical protein EG028_12080 [Chitinophaga barathri]
MLNLKLLPALAAVISLTAACRKTVKEPKPDYRHRTLNDTEVRYLQPFSLDVDEDSAGDLYFTVGLINDTEGTHAKFAVVSMLSAKLLSIPDSVARLRKNENIPLVPDHPREWNGYDTYLCEIFIPRINPTGAVTWRGSWVAADRQYLGMQFMSGQTAYLGWVSMSVDTARDCMVLHECAWRAASAGDVTAGVTRN